MFPFALFNKPETPTKSEAETADPLRLLTNGSGLLGNNPLPFPSLPPNFEALRMMLPAAAAAMPLIPMYPPVPQELPSGFGGLLEQPLGYHPYSLDGVRRKNATRETTALLKKWLADHRSNPYPNKGEKVLLAINSRMTLTQVSTWFANARRRLKKENGGATWKPPSDEDDASRPQSSASEKDDLDISTDVENGQKESIASEEPKKKIWSIVDTLANSSKDEYDERNLRNLLLFRQQMALLYGQLPPELIASMTSASSDEKTENETKTELDTDE